MLVIYLCLPTASSTKNSSKTEAFCRFPLGGWVGETFKELTRTFYLQTNIWRDPTRDPQEFGTNRCGIRDPYINLVTQEKVNMFFTKTSKCGV